MFVIQSVWREYSNILPETLPVSTKFTQSSNVLCRAHSMRGKWNYLKGLVGFKLYYQTERHFLRLALEMAKLSKMSTLKRYEEIW